jgi:biotin carboxyl carrier protein
MTRTYRLALVVALAAASCQAGPEDESEAAPLPQRVDPAGRVVLTQAELQALDLEMSAARRETLSTRSLRFGKVSARPEEEALIVAPMTARIVSPPSVALGAEVSEGDALVSIEPLADAASRSGMAAQRWELQGQVGGARARLRALTAELDRVRRLVAARLATEADESRARAELEAEQARLASLRGAGDALATMTGGSLTIRASAGGVVAALASSVGALLAQGDVIARIVRAGPRWVDVSSAPGDELGSSYRVRTAAGSWVDARLLSPGLVVQSDGTRHDRIEVAAADAPWVLPGAIVAVEIVREVEGVIASEQAVVLEGSQPVVFVETEAGKFTPREVALGARGDGRVVLSGVEPGERVVTRGAMALLGELGQSSGSSQRAEPK